MVNRGFFQYNNGRTIARGTAPTLTSASITPTTSATAGSNNARPTMNMEM